MTLLITIFGGMLLTALLYAIGRLFRLTNFWAAVTAAGLPGLAYIFYAFARWPGLDVVTMHVVAYPTVSLLFYLLYERKPGKDLDLHWAPKLLIGFFVILTVLLGSFVYVAVNGLPLAIAQIILPNAQGKILHTGFAGVVEHGEDAAHGIAQQRDIGARLAHLGWSVEVVGLDALRRDRSEEIKVLLSKDGVGVRGQHLSFCLHRPGQEVQPARLMREVSPGDYRGSVVLPAQGIWVASITIAVQGGRPIILEHDFGHE